MNPYLGAIRFDGQSGQHDYGQFAVRPLTGSIGALVSGVDLAAPPKSSMIDAIYSALANHLVLFFERQSLNAAQLVRLGRCFGELHTNPFAAGLPEAPEIMTVRSEENDTLRFAEKWHSDLSWEPCPSMGSLLYAAKIPPFGGDTLFANMYLAYETLDAITKAQLEGRHAVHTVMVNHSSNPQYAAIPDNPVTHPIFRTHPVTDRKALFVNEYFTTGIVGMDKKEAQPLLSRLFQHAVRPDFCCRYRWSQGDLAFWDNRCTQHYATNDYAGQSRLMLRATIVGDEPY